MYLAMCLTGRYPEWYKGRHWDRPVRIWVASETGEVCRDTIQRLLIGEPKDRFQWGTGAVPKECLPDFNGHEGWSPRPGIPDAIGSLTVKHKSGGYSTVGFKSFDQSRTRFQGESLDICYLDEEPDYPIYSECLTRTNATDGLVIMTYTPIKGMTNLSLRFFEEEHKDRALIQMRLEDAEHFSPEQRQRIIESYEPWELEARTKGYPSMGAGRVFQVTEEKITGYKSIWPKYVEKAVELMYASAKGKPVKSSFPFHKHKKIMNDKMLSMTLVEGEDLNKLEHIKDTIYQKYNEIKINNKKDNSLVLKIM